MDRPHRAQASHDSQDNAESDGPLSYRLCPRCLRAVPASSGERYCVNDGTRLLDACFHCGARVTSPYARHCARCGTSLTQEPGHPEPE